jgi:hypothetical protein
MIPNTFIYFTKLYFFKKYIQQKNMVVTQWTKGMSGRVSLQKKIEFVIASSI